MVAEDELAGTVELHFFDGLVDEADPERWTAMRPQPAEPPEDWSGSVDINNEDLPDKKLHIFHDWQSTFDPFEPTDM